MALVQGSGAGGGGQPKKKKRTVMKKHKAPKLTTKTKSEPANMKAVTKSVTSAKKKTMTAAAKKERPVRGTAHRGDGKPLVMADKDYQKNLKNEPSSTISDKRGSVAKPKKPKKAKLRKRTVTLTKTIKKPL